MSPTVCMYCGLNFMKKFDEDNVCNNCCRRFTPANVTPSIPTKRTVKAQIEMPDEIYKKIEEYCINEGISFSTYFLGLSHYFKKKECIIEEVEQETEPLFLSNMEKKTPINDKPIPRSLKTKRKREKNIDN